MNTLLDLIERWSGKFTYRILGLIGASQEARDRFLKGMQEKRQDVIEADRELSKHMFRANWIIYALVFAGGIVVYRYFENRRR